MNTKLGVVFILIAAGRSIVRTYLYVFIGHIHVVEAAVHF